MVAAWCIVWLGNLTGSVTVALLFAGAGGLAEGVGDAARSVAADKLAKSAIATFSSGILANALVCLAVWMSMNANTLPAKILAITGPISVFAAAGLEHSVANMSLIPMGWLSGMAVDWASGLLNLTFSTAGNIVGGSLLALALAYGHDTLKP